MTPRSPSQTLPYPDLDLLFLEDLLSAAERDRLRSLRNFFQAEIRPISVEYWNRAEFPHHLLPLLAQENLVGLQHDAHSRLFAGLVQMELTRADTSIATFFGVHNELFCAAVETLGSDRHREELLPELKAMRKIGCFALTEPEHGSDISRNTSTTAERSGDGWVLRSEKRWIGNGTFADYVLVWARDLADNQIKGYIVEGERAGFTAAPIENKIAARIVQNAHITLENVWVPDENRLSECRSFQDVNVLLMNSRLWVSWQTVGQQLAAIDVTRAYALERLQFGKPIASFQLVQEQLSRMVGNAMLSLSLLIQLARLQESGHLTMDHAAMAKATCSLRMRETVALGRSIAGGNGISTDFEIAKIFADAEAIFTYEGTYEINALIVGRALTGISAFN